MKISTKIMWTLYLATFCTCQFPKGFRFGASTAAFQIEGAWLDDNKSPSVWDNLAHLPGYTADGSSPEIAADSYHRYPEDIELLKAAGIKHYRLSISWPRIVPRGHAGTALNQKAIAHYTEMFEAFEKAGISIGQRKNTNQKILTTKPDSLYVTLYHWDIPAILAIQGQGLIDPYFVKNFVYYANACFEHFGKYVKYWFTFNEPYCMALRGEMREKDRGTRPYLIAHNTLLAHAETVKLFREKYQKKLNAKIGMVFNSRMSYPKRESSPEDLEARDRDLLFSLGWFADPIFFGDYPELMKQRAGNRLPTFTTEQKKMLKGSTDFFAINHYSANVTEPGTYSKAVDFWSDKNTSGSFKPEWKLSDMGWAIVPEGMHDLIVYIHKRYLEPSKMEFMVTENGMANKELSIQDAENDRARIDYLRDYLKNIKRAIDEDGVNVTGYFVWSLLDNFEWKLGYSKRFGIIRVEYTNPPTRHPKGSYHWYTKFIKENERNPLIE